MRHIRRIIGLHVTSGLSVRLISRALNVPPSTVADYIRRYKAGELTLVEIKNLNDRQVYAALFPEKAKRPSPSRPARPKDKAKVELSVKLVQRWILARLRHRQFFSLAELNAAIRELLHDLNRRVIKYLGKSRYELYLELDQPALKPLSTHIYTYRAFKECRVNIDYHIQLEKAFYSVPYQLAGRVVTARYSEATVEIYHEHARVAVHRRLYRQGRYSTHKEHMASAHRAYAEWTPSRIIGWGKSYGPHTGALMEKILQVKPHPEMGFRSCMGILRQAKNHDPARIEAVSKRMLELGLYRVKHFKAILSNKVYDTAEIATVLVPDSHHENVRGQAYYQ